MPKAVMACTSTSTGERPDVGHPARPDRAAGQRGEDAEQEAGEDAAARSRAARPPPRQRRVVALGPRARQRGDERPAARSGTRVQAGVGPLSGSAASSGNIGSGPSATTPGETSVPVPTVKPGPSR